MSLYFLMSNILFYLEHPIIWEFFCWVCERNSQVYVYNPASNNSLKFCSVEIFKSAASQAVFL